MTNLDEISVNIGKLMAQVESLTTAMETVETELKVINQRYDTGKGLAFGLVIASASVGGVVGHFSSKLLGAFLG